MTLLIAAAGVISICHQYTVQILIHFLIRGASLHAVPGLPGNCTVTSETRGCKRHLDGNRRSTAIGVRGNGGVTNDRSRADDLTAHCVIAQYSPCHMQLEKAEPGTMAPPSPGPSDLPNGKR